MNEYWKGGWVRYLGRMEEGGDEEKKERSREEEKGRWGRERKGRRGGKGIEGRGMVRRGRTEDRSEEEESIRYNNKNSII